MLVTPMFATSYIDSVLSAPVGDGYGASREVGDHAYASREARAMAEEIAATNRRNRDAAERRARELLESFLDPVQLAEFRDNGSFIVQGARSTYRINRGRIANIDVLTGRSRRRLRRLCVHPENQAVMPIEDIMLSQLLHLRSNERRLLETANVHPA